MRVLSNAVWMLLCRFAADLLSFVLFAAIARVFGPSGTGEYAYAFALGNLAALIASGGFEEYGIRQYVLASPAERGALWRDILSTQWRRLLLTLVLLALYLVLARSQGARGVMVAELSLFLMGWGVAHTLFIPAMAAQAMILPSLTDLAARLGAVLVALGLLQLGVPLPVLLLGFPLAGVISVLVAARTARRHGAPPRFGASWDATLAVSRGTAPFVGSDLLNQLYARIDLLLIASLLGTTQVGFYALGAKFVEVGVIPLLLFGTAAYPLLSRLAAENPGQFERAAREVLYLIGLLSAWLAIGIACLVPLLVPLIFGDAFRPALALLPWFALLALGKGGEIALYRLMYSLHAQTQYLRCLLIGTITIAVLNVALIPRLGIFGAVLAAVVSSLVVDVLCVCALRTRLRAALFIGAGLRIALMLAATALLYYGAVRLGASAWLSALLACGVAPLCGAALGLVPRPHSSALLHHPPGTPSLTPAEVTRDG